MPGLYRDEGVVLRTIKLGEADRIVTILTLGNGKIRAVAKGIRKTTSKFGARLEPGNHEAAVVGQREPADQLSRCGIERHDVGAQPSKSEEVVSTALGGDWEFRGIRPPRREA